MAKIHDQRWLAAKKFIEAKVNPLLMNEQYVAAYDGDSITIRGPVEINEESRSLLLILGDGCVQSLYEGDLDEDGGAYTPTREWVADLRQRLEIFKQVKY